MIDGHRIEETRNAIFLLIVFLMILMMVCGMLEYDVLPQEITKPDQVLELRNPTYGEAVWFLQHNPVSERDYIAENNEYVCYHFARDTAKAAEEYGIRCYVVIMFAETKDQGHAIIAFETTDWGLQYFNPQNDKNIRPSDWVYG